MKTENSLLQKRLKYISDFFSILMQDDLALQVMNKRPEITSSSALYQVVLARSNGDVCSEIFRYVISKCLNLPTELSYHDWVYIADICVEGMWGDFENMRELPYGARQSVLQYLIHMFLRLQTIAREDVSESSCMKG